MWLRGDVREWGRNLPKIPHLGLDYFRNLCGDELIIVNKRGEGGLKAVVLVRTMRNIYCGPCPQGAGNPVREPNYVPF